MSKLKTVDFTKPMTLADRFENLPEGYELYATDFGAIFFSGVKRGAWCNFAKETDVDIICKRASGKEVGYEEDGRLTKTGEQILFPSKDMRDNSRFYAPAKDEVVEFSIGESYAIHIAGKWFKVNRNSMKWEEVSQIYISGSGFFDVTTEVEIALEEIKNELGLSLNLDTLEWSEAEKEELKQEIILSDGTIAHEGDEVMILENGSWISAVLLKTAMSEDSIRYYCRDIEDYERWHKIALLKEGNEHLLYEPFQPWHIGKKWPSGFRTGQPVLHMVSLGYTYGIYSHFKDGHNYPHVLAGQISCEEGKILPYQGNEALVGTNEQPKAK